jgi:hypothetical protein
MTVVVAVLTAAALSAVAAVPATGASDFRSCRQVNFTPKSDDVAAGIRVKNVSCRYARRFIRASGGAPGADFRGFLCRSTSSDDPMELAHTRYRCQRGPRVIRWKRY